MPLLDETVDTVDLDLHPNEASDLAVVPGGIAGFDQAFVTVLDEGVIEASVAVLGHRGDDVTDGWEAVRLRFAPVSDAGRTEDAEACDFWGEHLYILGSHFGSKDGPLEAKRAWIARVRVADLGAAVAGGAPPIEIAPHPLRPPPGGKERPPPAGGAVCGVGARAGGGARARRGRGGGGGGGGGGARG